MAYESIADIFSANQAIRERFITAVSAIPDEKAAIIPDGEKWSINKIVEHVAMVDNGIARICRKLTGAAKDAGRESSGAIAVSAQVLEQIAGLPNTRLEAPAVVHPSGKVAISESLERMTQNLAAFESLRDDLETYDLSEGKFPHPYFGPMTAAEWLLLAGAHEERHLNQILRRL